MNPKTVDLGPALAGNLAQHVIDNAVSYGDHTLDTHSDASGVVQLVVEELTAWLDNHADEERCVFCDERKPPHEFEDGLRCKSCAEDQSE